jgi:Ser/Thr protein kinase RdoA (MazF antagonist)
MFYDGQDITFFDFDDMSYKHFISDIAIIIFYQFGLAPLTEEQTIDKSVTFLKPFLEGYREFNTIDKIWFERLNDFLKLRELILIMVLHAAGKEVIEGNFGQFYMNKFLPRAKNDTPFFDIQQVLNGIY